MALCLARGAGRLGSCFASGDDAGKLYSESSATTVGKRQGRWRMTGGVRAAALVHEAPPLATLGLRANATTSEIKSAYRKLAKLYHPDVCRGDECQTKFIQISNAYEDALKCLSIYGSDYRTSDIGENFADELEDWEEWMGWEGAGTLDF